MSEQIQQLAKLGDVKVNIHGQALGLGNRILTTHIPFWLLWSVSETIHEIGLDRVYLLIAFADKLREHLQITNIPDQSQAFTGAMTAIANMLDLPPTSKDTPKDRALALTYHLLRSRSISHARAAEIASQLLGAEFSTEAWRRRVERWARKHNLPKVEKRIIA